MTKSELREMIRECIQEELNAGAIAETLNVKNSDGHFSIVQFAKNIHDNLIANKVDCTVSLESGYKIKVECDNFNGVDDIVKNTKELVANNMEPDIEDHGSYRFYMLKQKAENKLTESASVEMNWDDLIQEADNLLLELIRKSGNANYDDGDGYWQEEYTIWCNRKLYYIRLNDAAGLEKLCAEYSKKLPNVEFYFYDDEDEEVSEIGYVATK